jgi:hypothetical protein
MLQFLLNYEGFGYEILIEENRHFVLPSVKLLDGMASWISRIKIFNPLKIEKRLKLLGLRGQLFFFFFSLKLNWLKFLFDI